jgi:lysophospholipase L1-like esterase
MAKILAEIEKPGCLVLDYEANCVSTELLRETLPQFIEIYREAHPQVPILVVSRPPYAMERFDEELLKQRLERKLLQMNTVESFRKRGDSLIYFYDGEDLLGDNYEDCTVDGVHPTDLGFSRMGKKLGKALSSIL